jgi:hypothetical protein
MSKELLHYCVEQLTKRPRRLVVHQPLSSPTKTKFIRQWAKARFDEQQRSIITYHPDHPDYGLGDLLYYNLHWEEQSTTPDQNPTSSLWHLCIVHTASPELSPRELILYAAVSGAPIKVPFNNAIFASTKNRMMGTNSTHKTGSLLPKLRPMVANVLWETRGTHNYIRAWNMATDITVEYY